MKGVTESNVPHTTHFNCWRTMVLFDVTNLRTRSTALKTTATPKCRRYSQSRMPTSCSETGIFAKTEIAFANSSRSITTDETASNNSAGTYKQTARQRRVVKSCCRVGYSAQKCRNNGGNRISA